MKRPLRLASLIGALGAGSLLLSACDASPYAAKVNGQVVTVNGLNHQLAAWASNRTWVQQFDASNSSAQGGSGTSVVGSGGPGTYSSAFVADILGDIVDVTAIRQHLARTGQLPTGDETVASRAVNEYLRAQYWTQFPPEVRDFLVDQLAYEAPLAQVPSDTSSLQGPYKQIQPYLFSSVCVVQTSVASLAQASTIISSGSVHGTTICYDQTALEGQSADFQAAVLKLVSPGQLSAPVKTSYGYQLLQLASRNSPGFDQGVQQVIAAATNQPPAITSILSSAKVEVNPRYGTWSDGQITPPHLASS